MLLGILIGLLSIIAGWFVTLTADTLPARRDLHETWRWPLQQLGLIGRTQQTDNVGEWQVRPRGWRYLLVWLAALILGGLAYTQFGWSGQGLLVASEAWFFLTIAVIDLEHRLVLNRMVLLALPLLLLANLALGFPSLTSALLGALVGFTLFISIALLVPGGMGMGDVKLAGLIGLATGLSGILPALLIGILAGGVASIVILVRNRFRYWHLLGQSAFCRGQTMAYAPYLVMGAWFVLFDGVQLLHNYLERL